MKNKEELKTKSFPKEVQLTLVNESTLEIFWPWTAQHLLKGAKYWNDYMTLDNIKESIMKGHMQLWIGSDEGGPLISLVTEINVYPTIRVLRLLFIGGSNFSYTKGFLEFIELWASRQGITRVELLGRIGWARILYHEGYEYHSTLISKDISDLKEH